MPGTELRGPSAHTRIGPQRGRLRNAAIVFEQPGGPYSKKPLGGRSKKRASVAGDSVDRRTARRSDVLTDS